MALITVAQARQNLPDVKAGTEEDAIITSIIIHADRVMARWCRFPLSVGATQPTLEVSTYTEHLDGPMFTEDRLSDRSGTSRKADGTVLELQMRFVQAVTEIRDDPDRAFPAGSVVVATDYELDGAIGRVYLLPQSTHGGWSRSRRSVRVTYTAGPAVLGDVPDDVMQAAQLMVRHLWDLRFVQSRETVVRDGGDESRRTDQIPDVVRQLLSGVKQWSRAIA